MTHTHNTDKTVDDVSWNYYLGETATKATRYHDNEQTRTFTMEHSLYGILHSVMDDHGRIHMVYFTNEENKLEKYNVFLFRNESYL